MSTWEKLKQRWVACKCGKYWVIILGIVIGGIGSWWLNKPVPPWIEFNYISATYEVGSTVIKVRGQYTAHKTCSREEQGTPPAAPDPLEWEQKVKGSGPQVISYAPRPAAPRLEVGTHSFEQEIPLEKGIRPDGWVVSVTASCAVEPIAVRSRSVEVEFLPQREKGLP